MEDVMHSPIPSHLRGSWYKTSSTADAAASVCQKGMPQTVDTNVGNINAIKEKRRVTQHAPHTQGHSTTQQESRCIQNTLRMWKSLHRGNRQRHGHTTQRAQDQLQTQRMGKVSHRQARTTTRASHHVGWHSTHHLHQQLEYTQS